MELVDLYRANRRSFTDLGRSLDEAEGAVVVPATPAWTVRDNFAHMAGVAADVLAGRLDGAATDPWTQAQVDARAGRTLAEVLDEWERLGPEVEVALAPREDRVDPRLVIDMWTHEQDVRGALGRPGGDRTTTVAWMVPMLVDGWVRRAAAAGLPGLRVVAGGATAGDPGAPVVVEVDPYEAARATTGRRSVAQVAGFAWSGTDDPTAYVPAVVVFTPAATDLHDG